MLDGENTSASHGTVQTKCPKEQDQFRYTWTQNNAGPTGEKNIQDRAKSQTPFKHILQYIYICMYVLLNKIELN
jgi:hypothetical protein